jgi:hypothetical protein
MEKRKLGFWEIWNMSFGFLGIQFGFALLGCQDFFKLLVQNHMISQLFGLPRL